MYLLRKTTTEDLMQVMEIIHQGKAYLKANGVDQWQNGYPNEQVIREDIENGYGFVLEYQENIVGTIALSFDGEPWYETIREGQWLSNDAFLVIHRMAVSHEMRHTQVATEMLRQAEQLCAKAHIRSIKIDTHADNVVMQRFVKKNGFKYCGVVILGKEGERLAFEKKW